jgi:GDP-mannose 6-dehydrogenase
MKLFICGAGYVGCVTAACCAKLGHDVAITDTNEVKVECLRAGLSPIIEPGLDDLIAAGVARGNLKALPAGSEAESALLEAEIAVICVGTPSRRDGTVDTKALRRAFESLAAAVVRRTTSLTVIVRSTALAPVLRQLLGQLEPRAAANVRVVLIPEFLRETTAISDFFNPPFLVAGGDDRKAAAHALRVFEGIDAPRFTTTLETASMLKYSCNAFHALKMAFANEIDSLAAALGADGREVLNLLMQDRVLNISTAYLRPGFAFGGSCLPKDLRALEALGHEKHESLPLLSAILPSNRRRLEKALEIIAATPFRRLCFIGLSFKVGSDDLRESPYVELAERLIGKGFSIKVFDPDLDPVRFVGANKERALRPPLHLAERLAASLDEACADAEAVVICKNVLSTVDSSSLFARGIPVYDLNAMTYGEREDSQAPSASWDTKTAGPSETY